MHTPQRSILSAPFILRETMNLVVKNSYSAAPRYLIEWKEKSISCRRPLRRCISELLDRIVAIYFRIPCFHPPTICRISRLASSDGMTRVSQLSGACEAVRRERKAPSPSRPLPTRRRPVSLARPGGAPLPPGLLIACCVGYCPTGARAAIFGLERPTRSPIAAA
jgi:hypothetical protein